ncbi:Alpha-xylosidase [Phycisphaerae bacterium RAS1]|nr:Alpha-xylosidase [Phycisphaerae bacterium RAS1]
MKQTSLALILAAATALGAPSVAQAGPPQLRGVSAEHALRVTCLRDDIIYFEFAAADAADAPAAPPTPMVAMTDWPGPTTIEPTDRSSFRTPAVQVSFDPASLALTILDLASVRPLELLTLRPLCLSPDGCEMSIRTQCDANAYGLGEQFDRPGESDGDWIGRVRKPGNAYGNGMEKFDGAWIGNAQFPILYALGDGFDNVALFIDDVHAERWDFRGQPWSFRTTGPRIAGYIITGPNLPDLRRDFMQIVGRPPVPPDEFFGLWVSEYGYESWDELEGVLQTLRQHDFPLDGFVLDLQWFGGITLHSEKSRMGRVAWDTERFPQPAHKLRELREKYNVGVIPIEESYISRGLPEHPTLAERGYLVRGRNGDSPLLLDEWWGVGGMLDWTSAAAADFWHDLKRQPLVEDGVFGHWIDLGEPENFHPWARYAAQGATGPDHAANANLYNFRWAESIARGYARHDVGRAPVILSRSGTCGIQRFGAAMWSGDIASRLSSLAAHLNVQMHMSLSGVDYFGADCGGFRRDRLDGDEDEMYTVWLAHAALLDFPLRPHTSNLENRYPTAPDRIGDLRSNLHNVRLRYALRPYLLELARRAATDGEPIAPPLVYYFQDDPAVRRMADQKMLGPRLMVVCAPWYGATVRDVYLPRGVWRDCYSGREYRSAGECIRDVPLRDAEGVFRLPLFERLDARLDGEAAIAR